MRKDHQKHGEELEAIEKPQLASDLAIGLLIQPIPIAGYRPGEQNSRDHTLRLCLVVIALLEHFIVPAPLQMQINQTANAGQRDERADHHIEGQIPGIICARARDTLYNPNQMLHWCTPTILSDLAGRVCRVAILHNAFGTHSKAAALQAPIDAGIGEVIKTRPVARLHGKEFQIRVHLSMPIKNSNFKENA